MYKALPNFYLRLYTLTNENACVYTRGKKIIQTETVFLISNYEDEWTGEQLIE